MFAIRSVRDGDDECWIRFQITLRAMPGEAKAGKGRYSQRGDQDSLYMRKLRRNVL